MKILPSILLSSCIILFTSAYSQNTNKSKTIEKLSLTINTFSKPPKKNTEKLFDPITLPNGKQKVTIDNFVRTETDNYFKIKTNDGYFGKLCHNSGPADVNHQSIIRTNRDTRYSYGIFDLSSPLTITLPQTKGRFISMMVMFYHN
jgi:hypothetical protein